MDVIAVFVDVVLLEDFVIFVAFFVFDFVINDTWFVLNLLVGFQVVFVVSIVAEVVFLTIVVANISVFVVFVNACVISIYFLAVDEAVVLVCLVSFGLLFEL